MLGDFVRSGLNAVGAVASCLSGLQGSAGAGGNGEMGVRPPRIFDNLGEWERIMAGWLMAFPITVGKYAYNVTTWPASGLDMQKWFKQRPNFEDSDGTAASARLRNFPIGHGRKADDFSREQYVLDKQREWLDRRPLLSTSSTFGPAVDEVKRTPAKNQQQAEADEPAAPRKPRGQKKEDATASPDGATTKKRGRRAISKTLDRIDGDMDESAEDAE